MNCDVLIIGSGLGGLSCGAILSKNGLNVGVLEKNPKIGGCLQSYSCRGDRFETGVHYAGSLDEGQTLYRLFDYLGVLPQIEMTVPDRLGFDHITFAGNDKVYRYACGYDNFIRTLAEDFPQEKAGIEAYCNRVRHVCRQFPLYDLENAENSVKHKVMNSSVTEEIAACTGHPLLQQVLAATNPLYAGIKDVTPFYVHALIMNSFIEGARHITNGSKLANALAGIITQNGGTVMTSKEVCRMTERDGCITEVHTTAHETYTARTVISAIHPAPTIAMTESTLLRSSYRSRIAGIAQTISPFVVNIAYDPRRCALPGGYNHYHYASANVWNNTSTGNRPDFFVLFPGERDETCCTASIFTYLPYDEMLPWKDTFHTVFANTTRGAEYESFKANKAKQLLELVETKYPGLQKAIYRQHAATALTYRDYMGTPQGALYGIRRDCRNLVQTFMPVRSKISNLLFTGQNINVHGILGVMINSLITCGELLDLNTLLKAIKS